MNLTESFVSHSSLTRCLIFVKSVVHKIQQLYGAYFVRHLDPAEIRTRVPDHDLKSAYYLDRLAMGPAFTITLIGNIITLETMMNVLGVTFDSKLQWGAHISKTIKKANTALHVIRLIKNFFNPVELGTLLTANYYSILYYNAEIWLLPKLNKNLKSTLLSA